MNRGILLSLGLVAALPFLKAQAPPAVSPISLALHPAAAPVPALKYLLLPDVADLVPGNAVFVYYRAFSPEWTGFWRKPEFEDKVEAWIHMPLADLPRAEMQWLSRSPPLKEIDFAARHEQCDWQLRDRVLERGPALVLPDIQAFRVFGNQLAARARLEMAEGHYDKAIYTLQTGFAMARHFNEAPTLIHGLVGLACAERMAEQLETLMQCPGSPNLYWALADLPRPFTDIRKTILSEKLLLHTLFPALHELRTTVMTPQRAKEVMEHALTILGSISGDFGPGAEAKLLETALVARAYPSAKRYLIKEGRSREQVESMPVGQVVLLYSIDQYLKLRDDLFKWAHLPAYQAFEGLRQADLGIRRARATLEEGLPFGSTLLPALQKVNFAQYRIDRRLAALCCVEAVRLHAAAHDGAWPATFSDIKEVPVPVDPVTGQDFQYSVSGNKAALSGRAMPGQQGNADYAVSYELLLNPR